MTTSITETLTERDTRKIVQIAIDSSPDYRSTIYALCNDGTLWRRVDDYAGCRWEQLLPIPQDPETNQ